MQATWSSTGVIYSRAPRVLSHRTKRSVELAADHCGGIRADAGVPALAHRDWASSGEILEPQAVEQELGDKLRLGEYKQSFGDEAYVISDFFFKKCALHDIL